jgi:N-acetylmuramoyl-L-alanine amidase
VPEEIGFYETAWQMSQQGGAGPFGDVARGAISVTSFLDVPADHWAVREIEAAKDAGLVYGYGNHLYQPASPVSRDQMAVYLARALAGGDEQVPPGPDEATFIDVGADHWAYRHVEYAHERDVVHGYSDGRYQPEYLLDRGQMAVFIARAVAGGETGLADYVPPETPTFPDVPAESWSYKAVEYLAARALVFGYPDALYHPEYICSRDQIAVYVARAFGLIGPSSSPRSAAPAPPK